MNLQEQLNRIQEMMTKIANEQFDDFGDVKKFKKIKKDWRKDMVSSKVRGIGNIKLALKGDSFENLINKIKNEFNLKNIKYTAEGNFGMAFYTDDGKVIKLTSDEKEINAIKNIVGKDINGVAKYYEIVDFPEYNLSAILMDNVERLTPEEISVYTILYSNQANFSDSDFWDLYNKKRTRKKILKQLAEELEEPPSDLGIKPVELELDEIEEYVEQYKELLTTLEENNIPTQDLHGGNIGRVDGELVHFDIMEF